jgi:hypothetical protein
MLSTESEQPERLGGDGAAGDAAGESHPPLSSSARGPLVWAAIFLAGVLFATAIALLCFRWLTSTEPNAILVLDGNQSLKDAVVTLRQIGSSNPPLAMNLEEKNSCSARFFLERGLQYELKVAKEGKEWGGAYRMAVGQYRITLPQFSELKTPRK